MTYLQPLFLRGEHLIGTLRGHNLGIGHWQMGTGGPAPLRMAELVARAGQVEQQKG